MEIKILNKIRTIREAENLTRDDFCKLTGIKFQTLVNYETGKSKSIASDQLEKITTNPNLKKYSLWLVSGMIAPESEQISPEIETERRRMKLPDNTEGYVIAHESLSVGAKYLAAKS